MSMGVISESEPTGSTSTSSKSIIIKKKSEKAQIGISSKLLLIHKMENNNVKLKVVKQDLGIQSNHHP